MASYRVVVLLRSNRVCPRLVVGSRLVENRRDVGLWSRRATGLLETGVYVEAVSGVGEFEDTVDVRGHFRESVAGHAYFSFVL